MKLSRQMYRQLVDLLSAQVADTEKQQAFIATAFFGSAILNSIRVGGASRDFAAQLIQVCTTYGMLEDGEHALFALLEELAARVGAEKQKFIGQIRATLGESPAPTSPSLTTTATLEFDTKILLRYFFDALDKSDWGRAEQLLNYLEGRTDIPAYFNMQRYRRQVERKVEQDTWHTLAERDYDLLRIFARHESPENMWEALQTFWEEYPGYDPDNLAEVGREIEYERVRERVRNGERETAWEALQIFLQAYPSHDPDNLADYLLHDQDNHQEALRRIQHAADHHSLSLDLSGLDLYSIPHQLAGLTHLRTLSLARNRLAAAPGELLALKQLEQLSLAGNQITRLGQEVTALTRLVSLNLNDNQLAGLPGSIVRLQRLEKLHLQQNNLRSLPRQVGRLSCLELLDVGGNRLQKVPPDLARLDNLHWLFLSNNELKQVPSAVFELSNLGWLFLHGNRLTNLPVNIGNLQRLKWLTLGDNRLLTLPPELGTLHALEHLSVVQGNPLSNLPGSVLSRGDKAVRGWLRQHDAPC